LGSTGSMGSMRSRDSWTCRSRWLIAGRRVTCRVAAASQQYLLQVSKKFKGWFQTPLPISLNCPCPAAPGMLAGISTEP
jgi:hypothetical protein